MAEDDPSSKQDFRSKVAYFKNLSNSRQYSKAKSGECAESEPSIHKAGASWMTSTVKRVPETEKSSDSFDEIASTIEEVSARNRRNISPDDMEVFQKPMCLVSTDEQNVLRIEAGAVDQIARIDLPIVVVSVVGLYRTGKSYLMNRLAQSTQGFVLGNTTQSTTKGIWVWCKIHPKKSDTVLLLLDTEGLGDVEKGDANHDNKILTIATLLCNCLVYNMKGVLDQDAINKLTLVTEIARSIRYKGDSSINLVLPDFVLCLRDFCLELSDGEKEDEYLENCLKTQKDKDDRFNKPKEYIRSFFPVRRCFAFPPPGDINVIKSLGTLEISALPEEFKTATQSFIEYIYSVQPKELLASKAINGQMFATLATHYVKAIQENDVTDVVDAFKAASNIENTRVEKEAFEIFETHMRNLNLPVSYSFLERYCTIAQQGTLNHLRKNVVHDIDGEYEQQAQVKFGNIVDKVVEENTEKLSEKCLDKVTEAYEEYIVEKIENGTFEQAGGYKEFQMSINKMKEDFINNFQDFEDNDVLWIWYIFMEMITDTETTIIESDSCMPSKEKKAGRKRNEEHIKSIMEENEKRQAELFEEERAKNEENYNKLYREQAERLSQEKQTLQEMEKQKKGKEKEYETLKERINQLEQESEKIKDLEKQQTNYLKLIKEQKEKLEKKGKAIQVVANSRRGKQLLCKELLTEYSKLTPKKGCTVQ